MTDKIEKKILELWNQEMGTSVNVLGSDGEIVEKTLLVARLGTVYNKLIETVMKTSAVTSEKSISSFRKLQWGIAVNRSRLEPLLKKIAAKLAPKKFQILKGKINALNAEQYLSTHKKNGKRSTIITSVQVAHHYTPVLH